MGVTKNVVNLPQSKNSSEESRGHPLERGDGQSVVQRLTFEDSALAPEIAHATELVNATVDDPTHL